MRRPRFPSEAQQTSYDAFAWVFERERELLDLPSRHFPLNTVSSWDGALGEGVIAENAVHHSADYPPRLILPVVGSRQ